MHAVETNNYPVLVSCLSRHADVNIGDKHKLTPLHYAIFKGFLPIAAALLQGKADPNIMDDQTVCFLFIGLRFVLL